MAYCGPIWISDFNFEKALRYRLNDAGLLGAAAVADARPVPSLLLWGGVDSLVAPYLEPAFVVEAPPPMREAPGPYRITGRAGDGTELFDLSFAMPRVPDGGRASRFAFTLPVQPAWAGSLASITLSGPGGSFTLDEDHDRPMVITLDGGDNVTGFIRDPGPAGGAAAMAPGGRVEPRRGVLFSRGIPAPDAWRR